MTPPDPKPIDPPMTDTTELRRLLAEATPGPWRQPVHHSGREHTHEDIVYGNSAEPFVASSLARNAALIVAAVNALPALLTELDALRAVERAARVAYGVRFMECHDCASDAPAEKCSCYAEANLGRSLDDLARLRTEGEK